MTTLTLTLPESLLEFVEQQAQAQGYPTVNDYICDVLQAIQAQDSNEQLNQFLVDNLDSAPK